jgi:hypothetical protein
VQNVPIGKDPSWGGSYARALPYANIAQKYGLGIMSEKRDRRNTLSGGISDHWSGNKNAYAFDLSNGSAPTKEMDRAATELAQSLGIPYDGKGELVQNVTRDGYRYQILYRTKVGGNHFDHIHFGVKKL